MDNAPLLTGCPSETWRGLPPATSESRVPQTPPGLGPGHEAEGERAARRSTWWEVRRQRMPGQK